MTTGQGSPLVVHGWTLYAHPLFMEQLERLASEVEALARKDPAGYRRRSATKRLAAIATLAFDRIPRDPTLAEYRLGHALGSGHTHWFRAKFFQQYRIFFRVHARSRIIVYGWVNDEQTLRAYESRTDAYRVFRGMIERGRPPDDWDQLLEEARTEGLRLRAIVRGKPPE
jgi:toxin YhaV